MKKGKVIENFTLYQITLNHFCSKRAYRGDIYKKSALEDCNQV